MCQLLFNNQPFPRAVNGPIVKQSRRLPGRLRRFNKCSAVAAASSVGGTTTIIPSKGSATPFFGGSVMMLMIAVVRKIMNV